MQCLTVAGFNTGLTSETMHRAIREGVNGGFELDPYSKEIEVVKQLAGNHYFRSLKEYSETLKQNGDVLAGVIWCIRDFDRVNNSRKTNGGYKEAGGLLYSKDPAKDRLHIANFCWSGYSYCFVHRIPFIDLSFVEGEALNFGRVSYAIFQISEWLENDIKNDYSPEELYEKYQSIYDTSKIRK
jgi:hypothetical protein